jgi:hypothetical protein
MAAMRNPQGDVHITPQSMSTQSKDQSNERTRSDQEVLWLQPTNIVVDLDQPAFYRFPLIGPKRSLIMYVAPEGTKNPRGELSIAN